VSRVADVADDRDADYTNVCRRLCSSVVALPLPRANDAVGDESPLRAF
jgi:hypothetical protein